MRTLLAILFTILFSSNAIATDNSYLCDKNIFTQSANTSIKNAPATIAIANKAISLMQNKLKMGNIKSADDRRKLHGRLIRLITLRDFHKKNIEWLKKGLKNCK